MDSDAKAIEYFDEEHAACCPDASVVYASYRSTINQIPAWCEHGVFIKNLLFGRYAHHFEVVASPSAADRYPSWYRVKNTQRFAILEREGFACAWCHERANDRYIEQVRGIRFADDLSALDAIAEHTSETVGPEVRAFFGHDADHLFTLGDWRLIEADIAAAIRADIKRLVGNSWIVASCERCNSGRRSQETSARRMLAVYARCLFERSGAPDWDDLEKFRTTLRVLSFRRRAAKTIQKAE